MSNAPSHRDHRRPFQGLKPFEEKNKSQFGGRDQEIHELFTLIEDFCQTVVFGKSGIGKTSLLRAGLMPELRKKFYHPVYVRIDFSAEKTPLQQLRDRVSESLSEMDPKVRAIGDTTLWEYLHDVDFMKGLVTPVLILDQFEEIFTLGANNPGVKELVIELADIVENRIPASVKKKFKTQGKIVPSRYSKLTYRVVVSLREDYLARLEELNTYMPSIMDNRFRVVQMTITQAMDAARKPAQDLVSESIAQEIISILPGVTQADFDLLKEKGEKDQKLKVEPFLLSLICHRINEKRIERNLDTFTSKLVNDFNIDNVISGYYDDSTASYGSNVTTAIENELLTESGYRKLQSLQQMQKSYEISDEVIDTLINARIIRKESRDEVDYVELIHDVLISVIKQRRDKRQAEEREARLKAERKAAQKKQNTKLAWFAGGIFLLLVLIVGILGYWVLNMQLENQTKVLEGTMYANNLLDDARIKEALDPTISFLETQEADRFVTNDTNLLDVKDFESIFEFEKKLKQQYSFRPFYLKKIELPPFVNKRHINSTKTRKLESGELLLFVRTAEYLMSKKIGISKDPDPSPWDTIRRETRSFKPYFVNSNLQVLYSDSTGLYRSQASLDNEILVSDNANFRELKNIEHLEGTKFLALSKYSSHILRFDLASANRGPRIIKSHSYVKFMKKISGTDVIYVAQDRNKTALYQINTSNPSRSKSFDLGNLGIQGA
ncbi:MAG: hypothetical protein AAF466_08005, partial [Bacteroidota bacterium]